MIIKTEFTRRIATSPTVQDLLDIIGELDDQLDMGARVKIIPSITQSGYLISFTQTKEIEDQEDVQT